MSKAPAVKIKDEKPSLTYQRDQDAQIVRGIFHYYEVPGGCMELVYRKYKGQQIERYELMDGEMCEIPLGLAKHLNTNCWYPVYEYSQIDPAMAKGVPISNRSSKPMQMRISKKVKRCGFQSLDFTEYENMDHRPSQLVGIETVKAPTFSAASVQ